ncbi:MAG: aminotransferase class I/II-fold pyridoxal phosphate-dependent enzyme [Bacteroidetes bacterium]|nr:aminotransferase class I/II-fold pyridoxal phosphate-dependent enzyme [Bacteroidota bacterium]
MARPARIYLSAPSAGERELNKIKKVIESGWIAPAGPHLDKFENVLSDYFDGKRVLVLNSGTAAIHLGLKLLGIQPGDKVICPTSSFCATTNPVLYEKAIPVFVDCEIESFGSDPDLIEEAILKESTKGEIPVVILAMHNYGMPCQMKRIQTIALKHGIPILEDAAEAMGSKFEGQLTGTLTDFGILSFNGNKIITTGGGGALLLQDDDMYSKALKLATQANEVLPYYHHITLGYNYRMSSVAAGIGLGQMETLEERVMRRKEIFRMYEDQLIHEGISFFQGPKNVESNRWLSLMLIDQTKMGFNNIDLKRHLEENNIESRICWQPLHVQPLYQQYDCYENGNAKWLFESGLCLPSGSGLSDEEVGRVIQVIIEYMK